ncbi:flagellar motor switch protein FliG [Candidatus Poribacteria bacterium]|nr:MAG: flagellar motor switch protein FliG [Candidatus Poribacteria bacterium]
MKGVDKAAALLVTLGTEVAAQIFRYLDEDEIEKISLRISSLKKITPEMRANAFREAYNYILAREYVEQGGFEFAKAVLTQALGEEEARRILERIKRALEGNPFEFLDKADPEQLITLLANEHPQVVSLILANLSPEHASAVFQGLPEEMRSEVANRVDSSVEKEVLKKLEEENPELAEKIKSLMFVFEDLLMLDDRDMQKLIRNIKDTRDLVLALKGATDELKEKFFRNMTQRMALMIKEDMEIMGRVPLREVEAAQQRIIQVAKELEEAGEIVLVRRGGGEEVFI